MSIIKRVAVLEKQPIPSVAVDKIARKDSWMRRGFLFGVEKRGETGIVRTSGRKAFFPRTPEILALEPVVEIGHD